MIAFLLDWNNRMYFWGKIIVLLFLSFYLALFITTYHYGLSVGLGTFFFFLGVCFYFGAVVLVGIWVTLKIVRQAILYQRAATRSGMSY
jgi:hypothetical protein